MNNNITVTLTKREILLVELALLDYDYNKSKAGNYQESRDAWAVYMKFSNAEREHQESSKALAGK